MKHSLNFLSLYCRNLTLLFFISIALLLIAGCGSASGGDSSTSQDGDSQSTDSGTGDSVKLSSLMLQYSDTPTQGKEVTISFATDEDIGKINWEVNSQPDLANLALITSADSKSVTFTAVESGDYEIIARSTTDNSEKLTSFYVYPIFSYDADKVDGYDEDSANLDEIIGVINNQVWVYSTSLTENQLREMILTYNVFSILGYDVVDGLLIEFDDSNESTKELLEILKLEKGIVSVDYRVHEGVDLPRDESTIPDDGASFNDGGSNWHLEYINAIEAWDFTTGSSDILIGVSDGGFDSDHSELKGRVSEVLTSDKKDHGNGVAGTIGANSNNKSGVSGINWVSDMILGDNGYSAFRSVVERDVVAINSSWAMTGKIPDDFDPSDSDSLQQRNQNTLSWTRTYRKLANANLDKLLVWSAGNGIGNGKGNDGVYGVNGRHHSPALHYNANGNLQKQANVIFVAAMQDDRRLRYSSNYGVSVDIAAPTKYRSLRINGGYYEAESYGKNNSPSGSFSGTSAAAPVVTGVASLIYSLYPGFTGEEVKNILIESATEYSTQRYIAPGDSGENNSNVTTLSHPLPILNASKALERAQEIIDGKVTASYSIIDPFEAEAQVDFTSIDKALKIDSVDWKLQSSNDGNSDNWILVSEMITNGDSIKFHLDTSNPYQRVVASVNLTSNNDVAIANIVYDFNYSNVEVATLSTITLDAVAGVSVSLESSKGIFDNAGVTDNEGTVRVYLEENGDYKVHASSDGYQEAVTAFVTDSAQIVVALNLTPDSSGDIGSLSGQIVDANGLALINASVRISGGEQTNGFFASAVTDESGAYIISNISKQDSNGDDIPYFTLEASADGYNTAVKYNVIVLSGKNRVENFTLILDNLSDITLYAYDFEQWADDWHGTGFWNQINLDDSTVVNTLVDSGYTSLAPDENSMQALLPDAFSGSTAWWYGQTNSGSFIGTQYSYDYLLSGGTSTSSHSGLLTSPSITLSTANTPLLRFRTWWEVESVNPNENGYDIMEIQVSTDGGSTFTSVRRLNPFIDPNESDRYSKPFSSGGYNRKPVWTLEEIDLSEYVGEVIHLRFKFATVDELYNGFRGWIIDAVEIIDVDNISSQASLATLGLVQEKTSSMREELRDEYFRIHKQPHNYLHVGMPNRLSQ